MHAESYCGANLSDIKEVTEEYIRREGLSPLIPHFRKQIALQVPPLAIITIWGLGNWVMSFLYMSPILNFSNLAAVLLAPASFILTLIIMVVIGLVLTLRRSNIEDKKMSQIFGAMVLLGFPVILSTGVGFYYSYLIDALIYFGLSMAWLVATFAIYQSRFLVKTALNIQTFLKTLTKSLLAASSLFPLLLTVILLSIFSGDLWPVIGNMEWSRLITVIGFIAFPPILLSYPKIFDETSRIVEKVQSKDSLYSRFTTAPFFKKLIENDLISKRSLSIVKREISWRDLEKANQDISEEILRISRRRFGLYTELFMLALIFFFFCYFFIFFLYLFEPGYLAGLIRQETHFDTGLYPSFETLFHPISKVSLTLAAIIGATARVSSFSTEETKKQIFGWLEEKVNEWRAIAITYSIHLSPGFQFWRYIVNDEKRFNASIVVPKGSKEENIEAACRTVAGRASQSTFLRVVTAFEKKEGFQNYDYGHEGKRWRLLINTTQDVDRFEENSLVLGQEPRFNHLLGFEILDKGEEIPEEWFGQGKRAVDVSRWIWEDDSEHDLVQHPYTFVLNSMLILEVQLLKRLANSDAYRSLAKKWFQVCFEKKGKAKDISVYVTLCETSDFLFSLELLDAMPSISYKDEHLKETKYEQKELWIPKTS